MVLGAFGEAEARNVTATKEKQDKKLDPRVGPGNSLSTQGPATSSKELHLSAMYMPCWLFKGGFEVSSSIV